MDNITHGLVGLIIAQLAVQLVGERAPNPGVGARSASPAATQASFASWAGWVSVLSNNLPDFDVLYAPVTGGKLAYLLHHRGHTHTLPLALLGGVSIAAISWLLVRWRRVPLGLVQWRALLALALLGPFLHILLDFGNDYGVHPFWPLDTRWFYGGAVFIVEPWIWVFSVPPLFIATRRRWGRVVLALILAAGIGLAFAVTFVGWGARLTLCVGALAFSVLCWWQRPRAARLTWMGTSGLLVLLGSCWMSAYLAHQRMLQAASRLGFSPDQVLAPVLTPSPGNPLCFSAILVTRRGPDYELRTAAVSSWPSLLPAASCRLEPRGFTLPLLPAPAAERAAMDASVALQQRWGAPVAQLRALGHQNCEVQAFLRFARAPFWLPSGPEAWVVGDLRYDRRRELEFAELRVARAPQHCPDWIPPWTPPIHELFARGSGAHAATP